MEEQNMFEEVSNIISDIPAAVMVAIVIGLIRSVLGWFENAYKDGVITDFEVKQLLGTIGKYFMGVLALSQGLPIEQAIVGTYGLDVVASALKANTKPSQ